MKGPKFKFIHKPTGLTFKQKAKRENGGITGIGSSSCYYEGGEYFQKLHLVPILLDSGQPAVYLKQDYYPSMIILSTNEWDVVLKTPEKSE